MKMTYTPYCPGPLTSTAVRNATLCSLVCGRPIYDKMSDTQQILFYTVYTVL